MNGWRSRTAVGLLIIGAWAAHSLATSGLPNTPVGMLWFHGSAAAVDLLLMYCLPRFLSGNLCTDMQLMCLVSIVANFVGWLAYLAYLSPVFYNGFMWGLAHAQAFRLLLVNDGNLNLGLHLVCRGNRIGPDIHYAKEPA